MVVVVGSLSWLDAVPLLHVRVRGCIIPAESLHRRPSQAGTVGCILAVCGCAVRSAPVWSSHPNPREYLKCFASHLRQQNTMLRARHTHGARVRAQLN